MTGVGSPPEAATLSSGLDDAVGENTIVPSAFQVPPRPVGASVICCGWVPEVNAEKLARREESDRSAVLGPERVFSAVCSRQRLRVGLVERPQPQPLRSINGRDEHDVPAIG